ncbi:probable serine/threonine-protein kinase kinX isoform X3 [Drosophila serrata]|uniref:probable serine/threonine-protein kinase kinX isoform X3 n=1 Tax=Drosophila serrata TaxID=7274 RepID=UPI000A1D1BC0|nr:probable serine/threonine-protein kinase kinX isoform X3 [Drosophila serrata]
MDGAPHGPLEPNLANEMMANYRLPAHMFNELKAEYDNMPPPWPPYIRSASGLEKVEAKKWPLLSQYKIPVKNRPQKQQQRQNWYQKPQESVPKEQNSPQGGSFFKPQDSISNPQGSIMKPASLNEAPMPIGYNGSTLMYYGSMKPIEKKSSQGDSGDNNVDDDESAYVDVEGFTESEDESENESTESFSEVEEDSDEYDLYYADLANMVIKPDPFCAELLGVDLEQQYQAMDYYEDGQYDESSSDEDDESSDDGNDFSDDDYDDDDDEDFVDGDFYDDYTTSEDDSDYEDDYPNDEGYEDETDGEGENMMDYVQYPVNPSHEIVRIVDSDLNRNEALDRIVGFL